jgi:hypothetical protein
LCAGNFRYDSQRLAHRLAYLFPPQLMILTFPLIVIAFYKTDVSQVNTQVAFTFVLYLLVEYFSQDVLRRIMYKRRAHAQDVQASETQRLLAERALLDEDALLRTGISRCTRVRAARVQLSRVRACRLGAGVQFVVVSTFGASLPLLVIIAVVYNLLRAKSEATLLLTLRRRPQPRHSRGQGAFVTRRAGPCGAANRHVELGPWSTLLTLLSVLSTLGAILIIHVTSDQIRDTFLRNTSIELQVLTFLVVEVRARRKGRARVCTRAARC